jgi:hypothetical protein
MARRTAAKAAKVQAQNAYRPCPQPSECQVGIPGLDAYKCATCGQWRDSISARIQERPSEV